MRTTTILARGTALAALILSLAPAASAADGAIRRVTLSSGGLAELVRELPVGGDGGVSFEVPLDQVDDVLKSLVVIGGSATVRSFSLAGEAPVDEVMGRMPFSAEDMAGLGSLLARLQGVRVEIVGAGPPLSGTVLGVSTSQGADGAADQVLALLDASGEAVSVRLAPETRLRILDEDVKAKIAEASAAMGRAKSDGSRRIGLTLDGPQGGTAEIAYVVAAPLWKTAYRVVTDPAAGTARFQAWAILENATGEAWDDVSLTLASGAPVTLRQRLFERYWRERQEVPVDVAGVAAPRPDEGAFRNRAVADFGEAMEQSGSGPAAALAMAPAPAPEPGRSYADIAAVEGAAASEGDTSATFEIPGAIDLAAGDTLSVPIIDRALPAERVALLQEGSEGPHPLAALSLTNDTGASLPPGILTVFDGSEGYLGDAQLLGAGTGETRLVSFALDRKVRILKEEEPELSLVRIKSVDGTLAAEYRRRVRVVYRIEGAPDGARTVIVEHAKRPGWTFSGAAVDGETGNVRRLRASVAAGETAQIEAVDERIEDQTYALDDVDPALLVSWNAELTDPAQKSVLDAIAAARREMARVETQLETNEDSRRRIEDEQRRLRSNLSAVPEGSALATGYLDDLAAQEGELDALEARRAALASELDGHREAMQAALRRL